jgi:CubicO group peptidase (beta-lactamase class C family)
VFDPKGRRLFEEKDGKALLIFQGGKLRFEHYAQGFDKASRLNSYSMIKSLVGALVLKAHAEGKIQSLEDPIGAYLPKLGDAGVRAVPIIDFLSMRSGIAFEPEAVKTMAGGGPKDIEETRINPFGAMARLHMLGLDAVAEGLRAQPKARGSFNYQNINTATLGRLLETVYNKPLDQLLSEKIWAPAGAGTAYWRRYGPGQAVTPYCCLYASPRDWLRIGLFLMGNGTKNRRFLPRPLWREFMGRQLSYNGVKDGHYGLHIYHNVLDRVGEPLQGSFTYMFGSRGQVVYLMPDLDLVVVRFGGQIQLLHSTLYAAWRSTPHSLKENSGAENGGSRVNCNY